MNVENLKSVEDMIKFAQEAGNSDAKFVAEMQTKSNENVDPTTNANWYDQYGMTNEIKDLSATNGQLLSRIQGGFEGNNLPDSYPVPYDIKNYKMKKKTGWRNSAKPANDNTVVEDLKGTIAPTPLIAQFGINDEMIATSTDKQIFDYIIKKASETAVNSAENMLINGDSTVASTGNVNSDDQLPSTTFDDGADEDSLQIANGLRRLAIANSNTVDIGAFDSDDLLSMRGKLAPRYMNKVSQLMYIFEPTSYLQMQADDALKLLVNSSMPSIDGKRADSTSAFGVYGFSHDLMPKTEADGKVSGATPADNVKGGITCVYTPAIRWGYGKDVLIEIERINGFGYEVTVTMKFGFNILDGANTVSAGINMTI